MRGKFFPLHQNSVVKVLFVIFSFLPHQSFYFLQESQLTLYYQNIFQLNNIANIWRDSAQSRPNMLIINKDESLLSYYSVQICCKNLANVVSNTTIILMYDEPGPETFMINIAIFFKTIFCFPYETKNILSIYYLYKCIILHFKNMAGTLEKGF